MSYYGVTRAVDDISESDEGQGGAASDSGESVYVRFCSLR